MPPSAFLSGIPSGLTAKTQRASARIAVMRTGTERNTFTALDDLGLYAGIAREEGESTVNFKARMLAILGSPSGAAQDNLTHAINGALGLGQATAIEVTADREVTLTVTDAELTVLASGVDSRHPLILSDDDGHWTYPTLDTIATELAALSGLTITVDATISGLPAILLDPVSSHVLVPYEPVPEVREFDLNYTYPGMPTPGVVLSGTFVFTNIDIFKTQVTNTPVAEGEWSYDITRNRIRTSTIPPPFGSVSYEYSVLGSGMTMPLAVHGARILTLAASGVQPLLFRNDGIGSTAASFLSEIHAQDRTRWGK